MIRSGDPPLPQNFKYRETYLQERPQHQATDPFRIRHPVMEIGRRAKIFAPFDALRGFSAAILAKDALYEPRRDLSEEERSALDRKLVRLRDQTPDSRLAKEARVPVRVTYFVPCTDRNSEAFGTAGRYETVTGFCLRVDFSAGQLLLLSGQTIPLKEICGIVSAEDGLSESVFP